MCFDYTHTAPLVSVTFIHTFTFLVFILETITACKTDCYDCLSTKLTSHLATLNVLHFLITAF